MEHIIYIYFLTNLIIAYFYKEQGDGISYFLYLSFLAIPIFLCSYIFFVIEWLWKKSMIKAWYRLYFTEYYKNANPMFIKIRKQQYQGIRIVKSENATAYNRFFLRQLDKKYNYGITK